jgi:hypothetical protein
MRAEVDGRLAEPDRVGARRRFAHQGQVLAAQQRLPLLRVDRLLQPPRIGEDELEVERRGGIEPHPAEMKRAAAWRCCERMRCGHGRSSLVTPGRRALISVNRGRGHARCHHPFTHCDRALSAIDTALPRAS